jgi:hypothetical protein
MGNPRLYILIGEFANESFDRSQDLLKATLRTSALTKAWLYREHRAYTLLIAGLVFLALIMAIFDAWLMFPVALLITFKLVTVINKTVVAKGVILGYQQLSTERVLNYGQPEDECYCLASVVRGGAGVKARKADAARSRDEGCGWKQQHQLFNRPASCVPLFKVDC